MCATCDYLAEREARINEDAAYWDRRAEEAETGPDRLQAHNIARLRRIERNTVWSLQVDHARKFHPLGDDAVPF